MYFMGWGEFYPFFYGDVNFERGGGMFIEEKEKFKLLFVWFFV